ncbi:MAG: hypothetical protein QOG75_2732 [Mycobacterium sp.]|jgi:hypothetical protein|nr:hypothetical protein [Mycobacterium sp.]
MAVLHSLLAVYGALDQAAVQTQDPQMRALVEQLLPGTTGPGQRGWYAEIQKFVRQNASEPAAAEFPSPQGALAELTGQTPGLEDTPATLSSREMGHLTYAAASLRSLKNSAIGRANPVPVLQEVEITLLDEILGLAGDMPQERGRSVSTTRDSRVTRLQEVLQPFTRLEDWAPLMAEAANADNGLVTPDVAAIPAITAIGENSGPLIRIAKAENGVPYTEEYHGKVTGEVIEVNGILCALLTTEFRRSPFDIEKVKGIVDPLNWDNCNKFFWDMERLRPDGGGSSQVLEYVSTHPDYYRIKTALKYRKEQRGKNAVINYDFANSRAGTGDSGQVRVDSGYILLSPTDDGIGTRVITSKMVAIDGLSPTAVAIYAASMGWVSIGEMMMFGADGPDAMRDPIDPVIPWKESPETETDTDTANRGGQTTTTPETGGPQPSQPPGVSRLLMAEATSRLADYIESASRESAVVAEKWVKGDLSIKDMVDYTDKFGGRLASEPWRIFDQMINQVATRPAPGGPADQRKGDGSP